MKASTLLLPLFQFTLSVFLFNRLVYMFSERKCKLERERERDRICYVLGSIFAEVIAMAVLAKVSVVSS